MNIKQAKEQIKNAITAYFSKDEFGNYIIPIEAQRPVFMVGPPGIGKTAIMKQIAQEMEVGLVSYSMTHHTRQSAIGLPFIAKRTYDEKEYEISEYTMSEIIASVYDMIEETGNKEGILFLDEINCVSETLAPAMLQFLQYKIFGRHCIPEGWIVVTAGNPPEYNNSVREFDIATLDRLKKIDVEPVFDIWKEYAYNSGVHPSIITYLEIKKDDFYKIETTVDGKSFVTARGWCDLSVMIQLYEKNNIKVDEKLISQYLQNKKIAKNFSVYYDLWKKYKSDYQIGKILSGLADENIKVRAKSAKFDERLSLLGLIISQITGELKSVCVEEDVLRRLLVCLKTVKTAIDSENPDALNEINKEIKNLNREKLNGDRSNTMSKDKAAVIMHTQRYLEEILKTIKEEKPNSGKAVLSIIKARFDALAKQLKVNSEAAGKKLSNAFFVLRRSFRRRSGNADFCNGTYNEQLQCAVYQSLRLQRVF